MYCILKLFISCIKIYIFKLKLSGTDFLLLCKCCILGLPRVRAWMRSVVNYPILTSTVFLWWQWLFLLFSCCLLWSNVCFLNYTFFFYVWMFSQWMICIFALVIKHWNQINFQTLILLFISLLISELLVSQQLYWGMISVLYNATLLLRQARLNRKQTRFLFCISLMDILNVH